MFPSIRYAGRLASDPLNDLGQGEAIMTIGTGSQTDTFGRWGDYSMTTIDPADGISFWHTNEYYVTTSSLNWFTRSVDSNFLPPQVQRRRLPRRLRRLRHLLQGLRLHQGLAQLRRLARDGKS